MSERWQLTLRSIIDIFRQTTPLLNHLPSLGRFPHLFLLWCFIIEFRVPQQKLEVLMIAEDLPAVSPRQLSAHPQFLPPHRGYETLLGLLSRN